MPLVRPIRRRVSAAGDRGGREEQQLLARRVVGLSYALSVHEKFATLYNNYPLVPQSGRIMARKSKAAQSDGSQQAAAVTKAEAARAAIAEGIESPKRAVAFIRERFGIDMAPQHFSASKTLERKKGGMKVKVRRAPVRTPAAPVPAPDVEAGLLAAMEAIKPLVASLGADRVRRIVDLVG